MSDQRGAKIGVTGHRILAEVDRVVAGIDRALDAVEAAFPGRHPRVVSALAEGADRVVAQRVLARSGAALEAVLPLPREDYATDFETEASRQEFDALLERAEQVVELPPAASRNEAYAAGGMYVLDRCDVLLAVWDGQGAQGGGGTGEIVGLARQRGLPLAWVHAGNRRPGTLEPTSLGKEQGLLTLESWPGK